MMPNTAFWQGKRVFLTGHTGFKGAWLAFWLKEMGADVFGFALKPPTKPSLFEVLDLASQIHHQHGDIRDLAVLHTALQKSVPDIVLHLAAQPLVRYSYDEPVETYSTNVMGTVHLLEAVRRTPSVKVCLAVTTDKCYRNLSLDRGYTETDVLGGFDPYSNSKACAELVSQAYFESYFQMRTNAPKIATARAGNVIGGGDWALDRLVPDTIRSFSQNQPVTIRYPEATRPWQHVFEPLSGYLLLTEGLWNGSLPSGEGWNLGPEREDAGPVRDVLDILCQSWGTPNPGWIQDKTEAPHEAKLLYLDNTKIKTQTPWRPKWNLRKSVEVTVSWYKHYSQNPQDIVDFSRRQLSEYLDN